MKRIIKTALALLLVAIGFYSYFYYQNNYRIAPISRERIAESYERSVVWLLDHRDQIHRDGNPMLWWMLSESGRISGDERVQKLVDEFHDHFDREAPYSIWQSFFRPEQFRNATLSPSEYAPLVEYQQYFLYGSTCSKQLAAESLIKAQHDTGFCWRGARIIRPACTTHQLMAFQMIKRNGCEIENIDAKISTLQNVISRQLRYDPRVVDVYLQRVLMLVSTGAAEQIKPRWIERVISAQQKDGGWSDVQPLIPLGSARYVGFNATALTVAKPTSNFHATAQGVLLTTLLLNPQFGRAGH